MVKDLIMFKTASWLKKNIKNNNIKVIDASWYLPNSKRNNLKEYRDSCIPGAIFFDIDKICDKNSSLPHMVPDRKFFEKEVSELGINIRNIIIVYCKEGINSSPRVWWFFKYFGHKKIYVLNGGFKAWRLSNGKIVRSHQVKKQKSTYKCDRIKKKYLIKYDNLFKIIKDNDNIVMDARPKERFLELKNEPRINIGKGKIKNSISSPFDIFDINGYIKSKREIRKIFNNLVKNYTLLICSCGSGISACVIAISLHHIGKNRWTVYDGSWTEWYTKFKN
ncbi:MAG: sulfurtransferase [Rickettsiales bacterium]|nr:sulfurtransferase [Rickettsiales bacterium]